MKIDLSNAFNNANREKFLDIVYQQFPEIYRFVWLCYGKESFLFFRDSEKIIRSRQGTQQGDPLASLLSCLIFHIAVVKINKLEGIKLNSWYMDDGNIIAHYKSISAIISIFDSLCKSIGVYLNTSKTEMAWVAGSPPSPNPLSNFPFKLCDINFMVVLGAPEGSVDWCDNYVLEKSVLKTQSIIDKLDLIKDSQISFLILRSCLSFSKMVYFLRTVPPGFLTRSTKSFDAAVIDALARLVNFRIDSQAYIQAQLSIAFGGLGLRNSTIHHSASFFSSIRVCLPRIKSLTNSIAVHSHNLMFSARALLADVLSDEAILTSSSQSALSAAIDQVNFQSLYDSADDANKARLLAVKQPHASDFFFAPPIAGLGLKLSSEDWEVAVAYKLGLKLNSTTFPCRSKGCSQLMDLQGLHSLRCGT